MYPRFGILLSSKVTKWSVNRNFWRRMFYDMVIGHMKSIPFDIVLVPKKWIILDHKNETHVAEFQKNIQFLCKIIKPNK